MLVQKRATFRASIASHTMAGRSSEVRNRRSSVHWALSPSITQFSSESSATVEKATISSPTNTDMTAGWTTKTPHLRTLVHFSGHVGNDYQDQSGGQARQLQVLPLLPRPKWCKDSSPSTNHHANAFDANSTTDELGGGTEAPAITGVELPHALLAPRGSALLEVSEPTAASDVPSHPLTRRTSKEIQKEGRKEDAASEAWDPVRRGTNGLGSFVATAARQRHANDGSRASVRLRLPSPEAAREVVRAEPGSGRNPGEGGRAS